MTIFTGSAVALITPFEEDTTRIDTEAFDRLVAFHVSHKTDALVIAGTTAESPTLSDEEKLMLIGHAVAIANGKIPVIAGTGSNNTQHAIELSKAAEEIGADALLVVTPYYNKATRQGLIDHYKAIADAVSIPVIVYHVPSRTGCSLTVEQLVEMAQHPGIVAIKDATGDMAFTRSLRAALPDDFAIYSGNDDLTLDVLEAGGQGVISVLANVLPDETHDLCEACFAGDSELAVARRDELMPLTKALYAEVNPVPVKYALHLMGAIEDSYRLPLTSPEAAVQESLREHLTQYGLLASQPI